MTTAVNTRNPIKARAGHTINFLLSSSIGHGPVREWSVRTAGRGHARSTHGIAADRRRGSHRRTTFLDCHKRREQHQQPVVQQVPHGPIAGAPARLDRRPRAFRRSRAEPPRSTTWMAAPERAGRRRPASRARRDEGGHLCSCGSRRRWTARRSRGSPRLPPALGAVARPSHSPRQATVALSCPGGQASSRDR